MSVSGILNLRKPIDCTSFDMVKRIRRLSGEKKVGHGGTLDPLASGVLPICLGRATRVSEFLADSSKTYRAVVTFGAATDTYDAEGKVTEEKDASHLTREMVEESLGPFRGIIMQEPPMYSALKHEGKRLYELAREGITVERPKRETAVHKLEIIKWDPPHATVYVDCGRGTYVRSLAHDIGQDLEVGCASYGAREAAYGTIRYTGLGHPRGIRGGRERRALAGPHFPDGLCDVQHARRNTGPEGGEGRNQRSADTSLLSRLRQDNHRGGTTIERLPRARRVDPLPSLFTGRPLSGRDLGAHAAGPVEPQAGLCSAGRGLSFA